MWGQLWSTGSTTHDMHWDKTKYDCADANDEGQKVKSFHLDQKKTKKFTKLLCIESVTWANLKKIVKTLTKWRGDWWRKAIDGISKTCWIFQNGTYFENLWFRSCLMIFLLKFCCTSKISLLRRVGWGTVDDDTFKVPRLFRAINCTFLYLISNLVVFESFSKEKKLNK